MSYRPPKVLVAGSFPDALNVNVALRGYLIDGFRKILPDSTVLGAPYEGATAAARALKPDLTVVFGSAYSDTTDYNILAAEVRKSGGKLVFWMHDDPYEFEGNFRVLHLLDAVFTNDAASVDFFPTDVPVFHLPMGGSHEAHYRAVVRRYGPELFFCGHVFSNRLKLFNTLAEKAPKLQRQAILMGTGLPTGQIPGWTELRIANSSLADFCNSALSVINIGRDFHFANSRFAIKPSTPGPRTFEAAFSGAAQIAIGDGLEIADYFEPDSEILIADSADELIDHWQRLKREPSLSLELGRRSQARAIAEHGYEHRAARILAAIYG
jgi:spore maturation protein CgeB